MLTKSWLFLVLEVFCFPREEEIALSIPTQHSYFPIICRRFPNSVAAYRKKILPSGRFAYTTRKIGIIDSTGLDISVNWGEGAAHWKLSWQISVRPLYDWDVIIQSEKEMRTCGFDWSELSCIKLHVLLFYPPLPAPTPYLFPGSDT